MFFSLGLQNPFLTQQCLNQELTLDLLDKFKNPEKHKSCLSIEEDEMEVKQAEGLVIDAGINHI